jgi:MFS family permease
MSGEEIRSSHRLRRRPVHATSGVLDETGQDPAVVEAEQAGPVTNGYAWSGRMRATGDVVETMIPRRLDRLPWSRWHWLVVTGLGITWILGGFEVIFVGAIASMLTHKDALGLTTRQAASAGTFYLVGAIAGAFIFGYLTDRFGRKNLFTITLAIYLVFTVASGLAWNYWSFVGFRLLAGAGIGGEYSAINSAIDELIPARVRGRVALAINGSWWVGTAGAAFFSYVLLHGLRESIGWRLGFFVGATLALAIIIIRRSIPESPRWLLTHGRAAEAEQAVPAERRALEDLASPYTAVRGRGPTSIPLLRGRASVPMLAFLAGRFERLLWGAAAIVIAVALARLLKWAVNRLEQRRPGEERELLRLRRRETAIVLVATAIPYATAIVVLVVVVSIFVSRNAAALGGTAFVGVHVGFAGGLIYGAMTSRVMCWPAIVKSQFRSAVPPGKLPVRRPVTR